MFPNLRAEMARNNVNLTHMAKVLGITVSTMSAKNSGNAQFTLDEALKIKRFLKTDLSLEKLFEKEEYDG